MVDGGRHSAGPVGALAACERPCRAWGYLVVARGGAAQQEALVD